MDNHQEYHMVYMRIYMELSISIENHLVLYVKIEPARICSPDVLSKVNCFFHCLLVYDKIMAIKAHYAHPPTYIYLYLHKSCWWLHTGSGLAVAIMEEIMELLRPINATRVLGGGDGADINMWPPQVPKGSIDIAREDYFHFHHTKGKYCDILGIFTTVLVLECFKEVLFMHFIHNNFKF